MPSLGEEERDNVLECLKSTWISSKGPFISEFEQAFASYVDAPFAASVSNGTVALHLALVALGIGPGDEVIVPTLTYVASANAVTYTGATPVFCDCDPRTWQMSADDVRNRITPRTRAIMPVHLYGGVCDMTALCTVAHNNGLFIIEDCAEAIGSYYNNKHVGNYGDIATFSFFGNKTITTGEGGMLVTRNQSLYERAIHLKGQGLATHRQYWHDVVGYNYRMTNICAAIGVAQMKKIHWLTDRKTQVAERYRTNLASTSVSFQFDTEESTNSNWMVSILVPSAAQRDRLRSWLDMSGVETRPVFYPVHTMPMYAQRYISLPASEDIARRGVSLPSWPGLTERQIDFICTRIKDFFADSSNAST